MEVIAFERTQQGTGASRRLRRAGRTPAIVYGAGQPAQQIELDHNDLTHALKKEVFHSSILSLKDEKSGKAQQVLLRAVQYHPFKPIILHIDFQRVDAKQKIHIKVPLHYLNQESCKAVKLDGATVTQVMNDLEVICLPGNLPSFIEVDLMDIQIGHSMHVKDVKLPAGVELTSHLEQDNPVIASAVGTAGDAAQAAADEASSAEAAPAA